MYVAGFTTTEDFPVVNGSPQPNNSIGDGFVFKLIDHGSVLAYSTYLGGSRVDSCEDIKVDPRGHAYVTGYTDQPSDTPLEVPFPTTGGAALTVNTGSTYAGFVTKFTKDGSGFVYSTLVKTQTTATINVQLYAIDIDTDPDGNGLYQAFACGEADGDGFHQVNAPQTFYAGGGKDAVVIGVNESGTFFTYGTYHGGTGFEEATDIDVANNGLVSITGETLSTDLPTASPVQAGSGGAVDAFVATFDPTSSTLLFSSYLGGIDEERGMAVVSDSAGTLYITGISTGASLPSAGTAWMPHQGKDDAFVAKIRNQSLQFTSHIGGFGEDRPYGIAIDAGSLYVCGEVAEFFAGEPDSFFSNMCNTLSLSVCIGHQTVNHGGVDSGGMIAGGFFAPDRPSIQEWADKGIDAFAFKVDLP